MRRLALAAVFIAAAATPARADRYTLDYDGAWLGVAPLGSVRLDLAVGADSYQAAARLKSSALLNIFEKTDLVAAASGVVGADGRLAWRRYDLDHSYAKKRRVTSLRLSDADAFRALITPSYRTWGNPPATDAEKRAARDPLSSLVAMSADVARTKTCGGVYATFDGRFLYDLALSGGRAGRFNDGGYEGPVLKCRLQYRPRAGFDPEDGTGRRRLPEGEIWFALPEGADVALPVRVSMPAPLGRAVIELKRLRRATGEALDIEAPAGALAP